MPVPEGFHLLAPLTLLAFSQERHFQLVRQSENGARSAAAATPMTNGKRQSTRCNDESLADFVRRRLGHEALERMAQPMVGGIYTADPGTAEFASDDASLSGNGARTSQPDSRVAQTEPSEYAAPIRTMRTVRRRDTEADTSGARYSLFLSFDRGMQLLTDTLAERISNFKSQISI